jgi:hypothetical protein
LRGLVRLASISWMKTCMIAVVIRIFTIGSLITDSGFCNPSSAAAQMLCTLALTLHSVQAS